MATTKVDRPTLLVSTQTYGRCHLPDAPNPMWAHWLHRGWLRILVPGRTLVHTCAHLASRGLRILVHGRTKRPRVCTLATQQVHADFSPWQDSKQPAQATCSSSKSMQTALPAALILEGQQHLRSMALVWQWPPAIPCHSWVSALHVPLTGGRTPATCQRLIAP